MNDENNIFLSVELLSNHSITTFNVLCPDLLWTIWNGLWQSVT